MRADEQFVAPGDSERPAYVLDLIRSRAELDGLRVLDLACRTGAFSHVLADAGCQVVGIEGRAENFNQIQPHPNATFLLGDVRDLNPDYGPFDVTLCLGILYHLDLPDAIGLMRAIRAITTGFAIIDTHLGEDRELFRFDDHTYRGHTYYEPPGWWSSIRNEKSWWFTASSLDQALDLAGWKVEHLPGVRWPGEPAGRQWLVVS